MFSKTATGAISFIYLIFFLTVVNGFKCFMDICEQNFQYCSSERERCFWCKDISHLCGTDSLPTQCNYYCKDIALQREQLVNSTFKERERYLLSNGYNYMITTYILAATVVALSVIIAILIYHLRGRNKTNDGDPERDQLMNKSTDSTKHEDAHEGEPNDDVDAGPVDDVSLQHQTKRESIESGVESLDQDVTADVDKIIVIVDSGPREATLTHKPTKDSGTLKEAPTRVMSPTVVGIADTYDFAIEGNHSNFFKKQRQPVTFASS